MTGMNGCKEGDVYTSKGMVFVVLSVAKGAYDELEARVALLDDHPRYAKQIKPGVVMEIGSYTSMWSEALRIASLPEQGKVSPW